MKTNEARNFIEALTQVSHQKHCFIHKENSRYVVDLKNENALTAKEIAFLAKDAFKACTEAKELTMEKKIYLMKALKTALQENKQDYLKSKGIFYRVFSSMFKYRTSTHKHLRSTLKKANKALKSHKDYLEQLKLAENNDRIERMKIDQFPLAIHKLLQGQENDLPQKEEGLLRSTSILSHLKDLEAYRSHLQSKGVFYEELDGMIESLDFAATIAIASEKDQPEEAAARILEKIQYLHKKGIEGDRVILPGGYDLQTKNGHSVLYEIKKTGNDTCSITLFTTGYESLAALQSAEDAKIISKRIRNLKKRGKPINIKDRKIQPAIVKLNAQAETRGFSTEDIQEWVKMQTLGTRFKSNNQRYEDVNFAALGLNLIRMTLMPLFFEDDVTEPMELLYKNFDLNLNKPRNFGRKHSSQIGGSCAVKSVSTWIHDCFGEKEYALFKQFISEREMKRLETLLEQEPDPTTREQLEMALLLGKKALEHRTKKAEKLRGDNE